MLAIELEKSATSHIPYISLEMLSDEQWQCAAEQQAIKNFRNWFGKEPASVAEALETQRAFLKALEEAEQREQAEVIEKRGRQERERESFVRSLSPMEVKTMKEAVHLLDYSTPDEWDFCKRMACLYSCVPLESDGDNLMNFLVTLYHYGRVQGVRQERIQKKKGGAA